MKKCGLKPKYVKQLTYFLLLISIGHCSEASGDKSSGCKKAKQVNSGHLLVSVATTRNKITAVEFLRLYNPVVLAKCARACFCLIACGGSLVAQMTCTKVTHCPKTTPHCGVMPRYFQLSH
jgi:hypothetical protein